MIDVTSVLPYADPAWRFTDAAGHEHYRAENDYPTLRFVLDSSKRWWCADCHEEHIEEHGHYECAQCGETVVPGEKTDTYHRYQPGRRAAYLNGQPISEDRARTIIESMRGSA
jgi:hypothetical protein